MGAPARGEERLCQVFRAFPADGPWPRAAVPFYAFCNDKEDTLVHMGVPLIGEKLISDQILFWAYP